MNISEAEVMIHEFDLQIEEIRNKIECLNVELESLYDAREPYVQTILNARKDDLEYVMNNTDAYHQWKRLLPSQTYEGGYFHDYLTRDNKVRKPEQQAFKLMFKRGEEPNPDLIAFIERWLPLSQYKRIDILRHDCGQDGHWKMIYQDNNWIIFEGDDFCYDWQICFTTTDLVSALRYVSNNHWYKE